MQSTRNRAWASLLVFAVALAARLVYVLQLRAAPFFSFTIGDAQGYHEWAQRLAAGDWLGQEVFYQAPLYPYFLGVLYAAFTDDILFVRIVQCCLGALACVAIADTARRIFSPRAGWLAGLGLALYPPAIFFDGLIQKSVLDLAFLTASLWGLAVATGSTRRLPWLTVGVAIGGLVLCRENALVFVLAIGAWLVATAVRRGRRQLACAALFAFGLALVLGPVALRNRIVGGGFYLTTSQLGPNLYIGNNPEADGTYRPLVPGRGNVRFEREDATRLAERALGRELSPAEVSRYWTGRVLDFVVEAPGDWLALLARKSWLAWNAIELEDSEDFHTFVTWSPPVARLAVVWHFGVLAPLAAFGLCVTWRERRRLSWLYLMTAAYASSVALFYVFARYRYPLVPFLILFASGGLAQASALWAGGDRRRLAIGGVAAVCVAVLSNWPTGFESHLGAATRYSIGRHLLLEGRTDEAERYLREALEIHPRMAPAHLRLATLLRGTGRADEAIAHYRTGIELQERRGAAVDANVYHELGQALLARGEPRLALREFERALRADPTSVLALNASAWLLATHPDPSLRRPKEAVRLAEEASRLTEQQAPAILDTLAAAYAAAGRWSEARETAERALAQLDATAQPELAAALRGRLARYEREEAFVEPAR